MKIALKNPQTGKTKEIKVGFSWTLFFFSFTSIPLFLRGLYGWGLFFGIYMVAYSSIPSLNIPDVDMSIAENVEELRKSLNMLYLAFAFGLGMEGNKLTAKNYLKKGWEFYDPDGEMTKMAKLRWKIS